MPRAQPKRAVRNNRPNKTTSFLSALGTLETIGKRAFPAFWGPGRSRFFWPDLTVIEKPSKTMGKRWFSAPRPWGWRRSSQGASSGAPWNHAETQRKPLGILVFLTIADRSITVMLAEALGRHWESYGYSKTLENVGISYVSASARTPRQTEIHCILCVSASARLPGQNKRIHIFCCSQLVRPDPSPYYMADARGQKKDSP